MIMFRIGSSNGGLQHPCCYWMVSIVYIFATSGILCIISVNCMAENTPVTSQMVNSNGSIININIEV